MFGEGGPIAGLRLETVVVAGRIFHTGAMMFPNAVLDGIVAGEIDLAYRRWTRRMHAPGGSQRTKVGVIAFDEVDIVDPESLTEADAARTGSDLATLNRWLVKKPEGDLYRIRLHFAGADERVELRESRPRKAEREKIVAGLAAMDRRSGRGPWTELFLTSIADNPAVLAETIAHGIGWERKPFKANVRRLKELGLTESLPTGYRLSPRGKAVLKHLRALPPTR